MTTKHLRRVWSVTATPFALLSFSLPWTPTSAANDDVLARSRDMYASLKSYADRGSVIVEYGSAAAPSRDRHTFTTYFNRDNPRSFYLDFEKNGGVDRYVIWGDPEAFHTWWKTTNVKTDYPNPNNTGALVDANTVGASSKIPTLLYAKALLRGALTNAKDVMSNGTEDIGGRKCYRLAGTTSDTYGTTGREVNVRKLTVWIDAESLLIRKVVEEWAPLPGAVNRWTTTFEPQANPAFDASKFQFTPPSGQR